MNLTPPETVQANTVYFLHVLSKHPVSLSACGVDQMIWRQTVSHCGSVVVVLGFGRAISLAFPSPSCGITNVI